MTDEQAPWRALITVDLKTVSTAAFNAALGEFEAKRKAMEELPPMDLTNGWKVFTPQISEAALLRNPLKGNRKPTLPTVKYYAEQMLAGEWKKTGEPVIFEAETGKALDLGHRCWASYLSGATFETYLVGDVPADENLFAYIDNGKSRTAADALSTAGLNGHSKILAPVIVMSDHYDRNDYDPGNKSESYGRMWPINYIRYAVAHPELREAARLMLGEHASATEIIGKTPAVFAGFKILEMHGEAVLDEFFAEVDAIGEDKPDGSPVKALHRALEADMRADKKMKMQKHQILGCVIKAFNAWYVDETIKGKVRLVANDPFPRFLGPQGEDGNGSDEEEDVTAASVTSLFDHRPDRPDLVG